MPLPPTGRAGLTHHPQDPGGITNHGISLRWLQQLDAAANEDTIKACTKAQAAELMRKHFWQPLRCEAMPKPLGLVLYDMAVNVGAGQAVRIFQASCNVVGEAHMDVFTPLAEDGLCGPRTLARCHDLAAVHLQYYTARHCIRAREAFYVRLAQKRDFLSPFLQGWRNRCKALLTYIAEIERED